LTPLSDANVVIGSAGGSTIGDRISRAVAVEASLPVLDNLDITLAARYDSYSDFGSKVSPQIDVKYDFMEGWAVRSSWGKGFAAPTFGALFSKVRVSLGHMLKVKAGLKFNKIQLVIKTLKLKSQKHLMLT